jgi:hypothetical protein
MAQDRDGATAPSIVGGFIVYDVPSDRPDLLAAVGRVALRHAHLDHEMKLTIKTLAGVTAREAFDATEFEGSSALRERVRKLARNSLGEGAPLIKLQALLKRCQDVTRRRNELIHAIWCRDVDTDSPGVFRGDSHAPLPTVEELDQLANGIRSLYQELSDARLTGYVAEALLGKAPG